MISAQFVNNMPIQYIAQSNQKKFINNTASQCNLVSAFYHVFNHSSPIDVALK